MSKSANNIIYFLMTITQANHGHWNRQYPRRT
jgi:hypothetical protein